MTQQYIEVIQAHMDGKGIEWRVKGNDGAWIHSEKPTFDFKFLEYRIAPEPKIPDSIDWSHVAAEFKFMARDEIDDVFLYEERPIASPEKVWVVMSSVAECKEISGLFASYKRGNMEWQDSLVERPQP